MSFVVYFRAWIFSSVFFFAGGFLISLSYFWSMFCEYLRGVSQSFKLDCCPFLCVPNFAQIFPAALLGDSNCEKNFASQQRLAKFLIETGRAETDGNEMKTGHLSISLLSVFWKGESTATNWRVFENYTGLY